MTKGHCKKLLARMKYDAPLFVFSRGKNAPGPYGFELRIDVEKTLQNCELADTPACRQGLLWALEDLGFNDISAVPDAG